MNVLVKLLTTVKLLTSFTVASIADLPVTLESTTARGAVLRCLMNGGVTARMDFGAQLLSRHCSPARALARGSVLIVFTAAPAPTTENLEFATRVTRRISILANLIIV